MAQPQHKVTTPFKRTAAHIFVSPGDAPAIITKPVAWMERQFNACQTPRDMLCIARLLPICLQQFPSYSNRKFQKSQFSRTAAHILFPLETPLRLSRNMLHGWKDNSMLAKPLAACSYLSSIVSELYDA